MPQTLMGAENHRRPAALYIAMRAAKKTVAITPTANGVERAIADEVEPDD